MRSIYLHNSLIKKHHVKPLKDLLAEHAKGDLIDIGCGNKPFYNFIKNKVDSYVGVDHTDTPHNINNADIISSAYDIPVENSSFDTVLISQVIEHLEDSRKSFTEINRILKSGGKVLLSWPFLYPLHEEPRDFYRLTPYAIEYLAKETGFQVIKINASSGFFITIFGFLSLFIGRKSSALYLFLYPLLFIVKYICILLEFIDRNKTGKNAWTWNYSSVLEKI